MISQRLTAAINEQIGKEFFSSYFYLGMAAWFEQNTLDGFATWMRVQVQEEGCHAMIFYNYLLEAGGSVKLPAIQQPPSDFTSPLDIFENGLAHEGVVTASVNNLVDIAIEEKDHATQSFLKWFVDEQVEEEANFSRIVGRLKLSEKSNGGGLFMIDNELGARIFVMPTPLVGKL